MTPRLRYVIVLGEVAARRCPVEHQGLRDRCPPELLAIALPQVLADRIAARAKELSLDQSVDSPFALLAKDNDIMWGGGRPDDITVLVSFIVDCADENAPSMDWDARTGPGEPPEAIIEAERIMREQREADLAAAERAAASGDDHAAFWP